MGVDARNAVRTLTASTGEKTSKRVALFADRRTFILSPAYWLVSQSLESPDVSVCLLFDAKSVGRLTGSNLELDSTVATATFLSTLV